MKGAFAVAGRPRLRLRPVRIASPQTATPVGGAQGSPKHEEPKRRNLGRRRQGWRLDRRALVFHAIIWLERHGRISCVNVKSASSISLTLPLSNTSCLVNACNPVVVLHNFESQSIACVCTDSIQRTAGLFAPRFRGSVEANERITLSTAMDSSQLGACNAHGATTMLSWHQRCSASVACFKMNQRLRQIKEATAGQGATLQLKNAADRANKLTTCLQAMQMQPSEQCPWGYVRYNNDLPSRGLQRAVQGARGHMLGAGLGRRDHAVYRRGLRRPGWTGSMCADCQLSHPYTGRPRSDGRESQT